ncbi:MAG: phosphoribosylformylglycinamidine synthase [Bacteroidetes bacterium CG23_combo_of_CG06-09_8_20_14_all_32_9]|nr:MAG: phosphoribosylformylglycinamidine synthase [Bacteroidetes bacterium CG23_combo_of_CG06-09_8_20_14_all_32_9]
MEFLAEINVMPLKALLDPQGKAVLQSMQNIGYKTASDVRIGKHINIEFNADTKEKAEKIIEDVCKKMLSNPIMENFSYSVKQVK